MIPSKIIEIGLQRTSMTFVEVGDGDAALGEERCYEYLNMAKDKVWAWYVASDTGKDRSWEEWTQEFNINQSEYPLPQVISDDNRIKKIQRLYVTYSDARYTRTNELIYTPATQKDRTTLPNDWAWYVANQPETDPIYYTSDKSIFVAPVPISTIQNGLKLTGVKKIPDYSSATGENDMVLPDDIHESLLDGLCVHLYYKKGNSNSAQVQDKNFSTATKEILTTERDTHIGPHFATYPPDYWNTTRNRNYSNPNSLY